MQHPQHDSNQFQIFSMYLLHKAYEAVCWHSATALKHVHGLSISQDLTTESFLTQCEGPKQPVVITGLTGKWPAQEAWTPEQLLKAYGDHKFKVGLTGTAVGDVA